MKYCAAYYSDTGIQKETNQDSLLLVQRGQTQDDEAVLAVICDGVGGLKMGERSSAAVVTAFRDWFYKRVLKLYVQETPETELFDDWDNLIQSLHIRLKDNSEKAGFRSGTTVETVVLLSHKKPDSYIHIDVEFGEGEGKIPVDKIVQRAEQYKPKERVTYKRIKEYILEKYGFKVHTAYIAEVKRSLGLPMYDAPNAVEKLKQARKHPTPEKVEAIKDALHYFAVI